MTKIVEDDDERHGVGVWSNGLEQYEWFRELDPFSTKSQGPRTHGRWHIQSTRHRDRVALCGKHFTHLFTPRRFQTIWQRRSPEQGEVCHQCDKADRIDASRTDG